jgi:hypothetical protein
MLDWLLLLLLAQDQPVFHSDVTLVHVDAEVREGGLSIAGLGKESFRVTDNGKPQTVLYFGHREVPLDILLLFDARAEMRPAIARIAEATRTALSDLNQGDSPLKWPSAATQAVADRADCGLHRRS